MANQDGTVILTGANGSAGLHASEHLLRSYPHLTAVFTVRSAAGTDENTNKLRKTIARFPNAKATIHEVDLGNLTAVHEFADRIASDVAAQRTPPLTAIICNAAYWNLVADPELTVDGFEKGLQVGHIAHVALVLRLVGSFGTDGGRVELISSVLHYHRKTPMSPYLPEIPADMDELARPASDPNKTARGYTGYSNLKLVVTTWMYPLNQHLQQDPRFSKITVVAMNPGNLPDSRVFSTNTPTSVKALMKFVVTPLLPVIRRVVDPVFRTSKEAGKDMIELAVNKSFEGARGYFTFLKEDQPDPAVLDETKQQRVWVKSAEWARIDQDKTPLKIT